MTFVTILCKNSARIILVRNECGEGGKSRDLKISHWPLSFNITWHFLSPVVGFFIIHKVLIFCEGLGLVIWAMILSLSLAKGWQLTLQGILLALNIPLPRCGSYKYWLALPRNPFVYALEVKLKFEFFVNFVFVIKVKFIWCSFKN